MQMSEEFFSDRNFIVAKMKVSHTHYCKQQTFSLTLLYSFNCSINVQITALMNNHQGCYKTQCSIFLYLEHKNHINYISICQSTEVKVSFF